MSDSDKRKSFPLRLSSELYDELRRWSELEMRSVNAQIEYLLREAVRNHGKRGSGRDKKPPGK